MEPEYLEIPPFLRRIVREGSMSTFKRVIETTAKFLKIASYNSSYEASMAKGYAQDLRAVLEIPIKRDVKLSPATIVRRGCSVSALLTAIELNDARADTQPDAWAVRNSQGYWVGIWGDKKTAEYVMSKQVGKGDEIVPVFIGCVYERR